MGWGERRRAEMRCGVRSLPEIEGLLTCTSHPQAACMVVVLAVRITFRLDKVGGGLGPLVGPREASKVRRWPAFLAARSSIRRISKLSCG